MSFYRDSNDKQALEAWNAAKSAPYRTLTTTPLAPTLGVEIQGVDLSRDLSDEQLTEIRRALAEHLVLVFRDQKISIDDQKRFARHFGSLHRHLLASSNLIAGASVDPEVLAWKTGKASRFTAGNGWHHDVSCDEQPIRASFLHVTKTPGEAGGDTVFANGYLAYESLSEPIKTLINGLTAVHDGAKGWTAGLGAKPQPGTNFPQNEHPVAPVHPATGRRFLYVNSAFTTHFPQLTRFESDALLDLLVRHVERNVAFQTRVHWSPNTLALWDNWAVQHHAVWDYYPFERWGARVSVVDGAPKAA
ncbi:MAG: TauD/TfdA family dioxygenase [Roseiarcus sp.]|jgi:taurine dioxygenase